MSDEPIFEHRVGSHSDDYGGDSDKRCTCQDAMTKNPTDTNQASEDELRTLDDILSQAFTDGASDTMWKNDRHVEIFATAKKELQALIRTEKLKLLAEVRERVVGGDEPGITNIMIAAEHAEQRTALNKLEAEL